MSVAAVIQMTSSPDVAANLATARGLLERARAQGAVLAVLPENFAIMGRKEADKVAVAEPGGEGPIQAFLGHSARELGMWIVGGTIPILDQAEPGLNQFHKAFFVYLSSTEFNDQRRLSRQRTS
jgi:nitrilase